MIKTFFLTLKKLTEQNKNMKQANLSLEIAKQLYNQGGVSKLFALDNYSEAELTRIEYPKSWTELKEISGVHINTESVISLFSHYHLTNKVNYNVFPRKRQAEASLALAQLLQLKERYNSGIEIEWNSKRKYYAIELHNFNSWVKTDVINSPLTFAFYVKDARDQFFENFKDNLLEKVKPLFM
ncbi:hypothetical protein CMU04_06265 [Elizabethkingia anophelis]|nr:hypothetical protein [Elizabethkingia anophelis]